MSLVATQQPVPSQTSGLRLRLKSTHRSCGHVQGAWWPHSTRLAEELPTLLAALRPRLGEVCRVSYHKSDWSVGPQPIHGLHTDVVGVTEPAHTFGLYGRQFGRLTLLVVPPYTDPNDAYTAVITAASPDDCSTPEELLGLSPHRYVDRRPTHLALSRWETEGGALYAVGA